MVLMARQAPSSIARSRSQSTKKAETDPGVEIGALLFPEPEEILNDVILDQMMVDG
jgi:hypothetical protein